MKRRILAGLACACVLLSGCSSLLDREYVSVTPHVTTETEEGDPSVLRAESYQELVNALVHLVSQHAESGTVRLYGDAERLDEDLDRACLEVVQEVPLGAYAVDYIKYSTVSAESVVTYSQAEVEISYRRTREQVDSIVSATGRSALQNEFSAALERCDGETVLRISHFSEDEAYIRSVFRQAYLSSPAAGVDMPELTVAIYPQQGLQRIVEVRMQYPGTPEDYAARTRSLQEIARTLTFPLLALPVPERVSAAADALLLRARHDPEAGGTAWHALDAGPANAQGMAMALRLLCEQLEINCLVVSGTRDGQPHFWNAVSLDDLWVCLDLSGDTPAALQSWDELAQKGYDWSDDLLFG